jgi:signal peptidase II
MSDLRAGRAPIESHAHVSGAGSPTHDSPGTDHAAGAGPDRATRVSPAEDHEAAGTRRPGRSPSHWLSFVLTAGAVVLLDQITKRYIDANLPLGDSWPNESWPIRIMHVKNTGAAFSMLQNQTLFLTVMSVVGLAAILLYFRYRPSDHPLLRYALALQLGGAIGNLIDRAFLGQVTDFIKFPYWPVFNVADSAISVGVVTVIALLLFAGGEGSKQPAHEQ